MLTKKQPDGTTVTHESFEERNNRLRILAAKLYVQCVNEELTIGELKKVANLLLRQAENSHL